MACSVTAKTSGGEKSFGRQLLLRNRISNNVGGVKHFWDALARALRRARHFALVEELPYQPKARS